ncbi:hypothetical protein SARC_15889 [Sphaeroforma arctica JP610]|uniref:Uncharacterized protein n=1 Tax=Sphaeroforma arctica JP610 TaxID=667725 RepID=A0A0L0F4N7_9EUKA|nr:hypothetical protein SARC_15889 [Sphaeroforma arctica JP610]KNC71569.1 hypothetical protein SARC_15889 [Sphaeroforma arctica JP610]|eukprot:XP_014145471.1 hypothetical protein SARC_15889 [Sphaeroforma arctica JP610]
MRNHLLTAKWRRAGAIGGEQLSEDDLLCDFEAFCRSQERVQQLLTEVNDTRTDTTDDPRTDAKSQDSHLDSTKNTHTDARADPKKHESLIDNTRSTHTVHTDSLKEKEARAEAVESAVSALENATQPHTSQEVSTKTYADKRIGATAADHTGGDGD